jgi:hypothetical protein
MVWETVAIAGGTALGGYLSGQQSAEAQRQANIANMALAQQSAAEGGRQFDIGMDVRALDVQRQQEASQSRREREDLINRQLGGQFRELRGENIGALAPFAEAGRGALAEQQAILGLGGQEAQEAAMGRFSESPGQRFLRERQEKATLRNAAALGGLGGGNVRSALQEQAFGRAQTGLQQHLANLGALSGRGQQAAGAGLQAGYGPGYVQTGADQGVVTDTAAGPEFQRYQPPPTYSPGQVNRGIIGQALGGIF